MSFLPCLAGRSVLCTKRLAQHLAPQMPGFGNQVLRYAFLSELDRAHINEQMRNLVPHRAKADALVTWFVLNKLLSLYRLDTAGNDDLGELLSLAASPIKVRNFRFGKHRGELIDDIARNDPSYISWLLRNAQDLDDDLRFTLEEALKAR
jgi:hypothetical protein